MPPGPQRLSTRQKIFNVVCALGKLGARGLLSLNVCLN